MSEQQLHLFEQPKFDPRAIGQHVAKYARENPYSEQEIRGGAIENLRGEDLAGQQTGARPDGPQGLSPAEILADVRAKLAEKSGNPVNR